MNARSSRRRPPRRSWSKRSQTRQAIRSRRVAADTMGKREFSTQLFRLALDNPGKVERAGTGQFAFASRRRRSV